MTAGPPPTRPAPAPLFAPEPDPTADQALHGRDQRRVVVVDEHHRVPRP